MVSSLPISRHKALTNLRAIRPLKALLVEHNGMDGLMPQLIHPHMPCWGALGAARSLYTYISNSVVIAAFFIFILSLSQARSEDRMLLYDAEGLKIRAHLQAGLNGVIENNLFWNFADNLAPSAGYNPRKQWLEGYIKPGISFKKDLNEYFQLYGKASVVASGTLGIDAYDT